MIYTKALENCRNLMEIDTKDSLIKAKKVDLEI